MRNDLLGVFGGWDNLRMMCDATNLHKEARNRVKFCVGQHIIILKIRPGPLYDLTIWSEDSGDFIGYAYTDCQETVRKSFKYYTGYSLSF